MDYTNSVPLHIQLKEKIEQKILDGEYTGKIPSERELMEEYYVSRSTVREGINQLVSEGAVEKKHGKGTFVATKPIPDWHGNISTTTETIQKMGMKPKVRLIYQEIIPLDQFLKDQTGLDEAYLFVRVRYADQVPIGIERHYYPISAGRDLLQYDLNKEAFYDLVEDQLSVHTLEADKVIMATKPSADDAKILQIDESESVLNVQRKTVDIDGDFVEFENAYYRGDMYAMHVKLARKGF